MASASLLQIGVSGLLAHKAALSTTGHNISNTDTEGYSRQQVSLETQTPQYSGTGYYGTGVSIESVRRVVDDYVINQLRLDTSAFEELDTYAENIAQIDTLLADTETGLAPGIQDFFSSLHAAADDPTSVPVRQLVISQAESLVERFATISSRLKQHNVTINQQLDTITAEINSIAGGISDLNKSISAATARGQGNSPNDLLDRRDELLRRLSEYVSVTVIPKSTNAVDVFVGNGQALVVGEESNRLVTVPGETDPFRRDLAFVSGDVQQTVTSLISGGELGGLLSFRGEILDKTINNVGRLAITLADEINQQHRLGLDLDGLFGGLFFEDINNDNARAARVVADRDNRSGNETRLGVTITDTTELKEYDYILSFPGPGGGRYILTRTDSGDVVKKGVLSGATPESIEVDGLEITIESGEIQEGDRFQIQPTRYGADLKVELERPERLAIASAISASSSLGNQGTGEIVSTEALDITTPSFDVPGQLSPPLVIVFTSPTTYDVLDNTNPAKPVDLVPPLRNLSFTPGIKNEMLPDSAAQTAVTSDGFLAGRLPDNFVLTPDDGPATNGYVPEILTVTTTNPATGIVSVQPPVSISASQSARLIANELSGLSGVTASARTFVQLSDFQNQAVGGLPMVLTINGVQINMPTDPDEPELLSPNYLADRLNHDEEFLTLGLTVKSDGERLTIESHKGDDINVTVRGDLFDQFTLTDIHGEQLVMTGAGGSTPAELTGTVDRSAGYNFDTGGPYRFSLRVNGGVAQEISLSGDQVLASDVVREVQRKIDQSDIVAGDVVVSIDALGQLSLTTRETGDAASLEIIDVSPALNFALGFTPSTDEGADVKHEATVGGVLNVVLEEGVELTSNASSTSGNLFQATPEARSTYLGYQITLDGLMEAGDKFTVEFNADGVSDNRNGLALTAIETTAYLDGESVTITESYGRLVEFVGAKTSQSIINSEASEGLLQQSVLVRDGLSGVNLDEEAADLIRYELGYNASAQVISVARSLFDTLINTFR